MVYFDVDHQLFHVLLGLVGTGADVPVLGDYDGDGKIDIAVYRPATGGWYILRSSANFTTFLSSSWGNPRRHAGAGRL
jgi:hypothetical protein